MLARYSNQQGQSLQSQGRIIAAIDQFQRAITQMPDYAEAHVHLAIAYEQVLDYDQAMVHYQIALSNFEYVPDQQNQGLLDWLLWLVTQDQRLLHCLWTQDDTLIYAAYNNLARLFIVHINDPARALHLLNRAAASPSISDADRATVLRNRGWAYLRLGFLTQAETDLCTAYTLDTTRAGPSCLLVELVRQRGDTDGDLSLCGEQKPLIHYCDTCIRYAPLPETITPSEVIEPDWIARAHECVLQQTLVDQPEE